MKEEALQHIEASTFVNLSGAYLRLGEVQKALEYCERAIPILRAMGNWERESYVIRVKLKDAGHKQAAQLSRTAGEAKVRISHRVSSLGEIHTT